MGIRYRYSILAVMFILLSGLAQGAVIGVSPGVADFRNMVKAGYAEAQFLITTNEVQNVTGTFAFEGEIADWMSVSPKSDTFTVSLDRPYEYRLIITPPANARNGNYTGTLRMTTSALGSVSSGAGSSVIAAVAVRIAVEITGEETVACRAGALDISPAEVGMPFTFSGIVYNDGNVRIRPEVVLDIYDQNRISIVSKKTFLGSQILPTTNDRISKDVENDLEIGQYFAEVYVKECGLRQTLTFDVVEKGGIVDKGTLIAIRANDFTYLNEPTPIVPVFRNQGPRKVFAKFRGEIRSREGNRIVMPIETDELEVMPGQTMEFPFFFTPDKAGDYVVSGRMVYNSKLTFEEKSKEIKVVRASGASLGLGGVFIIMAYVIIGILILIIIGKIRKERNKRRKIRW